MLTYAFGADDVSCIPWFPLVSGRFLYSQAISILRDSGEIDKYFSEDQGYDYRIGAAGLRILEADCDDAGGVGDKGFYAMEFFGLTLVTGIAVVVSLMQVIKRSWYK